MTSLYSPLYAKLGTILECSIKIFFLEPIFVEVRNSGLPTCALKKKGQFRKYFFGIFKILEHPFFSEHFQNVFEVQLGSRL